MKTTILTAAMLGALASPAVAATLNGSMGYGLAGGGNQLVIFDKLSDPTSATTLSLTGGTLDAIAYRPVTGELYGYSIGAGKASDAVYVIDTMTGALTNTGATFGAGAKIGSNARMGFDFNNAIDAARAVSTQDDNLVFFPDTFPSTNAGTVQRFTNLAYAAGDVNEGVNADIFANAYTNAIDGQTATTTLQYALDAKTNSLVTLANNAGTLATIGKVTYNGAELDFNARGGFDIVSLSEGDNLAIALLNVPGGPAMGTSGLYTIDLTTGAASFFGDPGQSSFIGFAAATNLSAVPLPASSLLLVGGLGALGAVARRRRRKA